MGLEPDSLVITKGRLRCFEHVEHGDDTDWIKHCTTMEVDGTEPMGWPRKTWWEGKKKDMKR